MQGHNNLSDLSYGSKLCELILLTLLNPFSVISVHFCVAGVNSYFIPIIAWAFAEQAHGWMAHSIARSPVLRRAQCLVVRVHHFEVLNQFYLFYLIILFYVVIILYWASQIVSPMLKLGDISGIK